MGCGGRSSNRLASQPGGLRVAAAGPDHLGVSPTSIIENDLLRRLEALPYDFCASAQTDLAQVGSVAFGDGQRFVKRGRIHVLLHRGPAVVVDGAQDVAESREIDDAFGKIGEHTHTDGFYKRDSFGFDFRLDQSVYAFEVEKAYAMVMPTDETPSPPWQSDRCRDKGLCGARFSVLCRAFEPDIPESIVNSSPRQCTKCGAFTMCSPLRCSPPTMSVRKGSECAFGST